MHTSLFAVGPERKVLTGWLAWRITFNDARNSTALRKFARSAQHREIGVSAIRAAFVAAQFKA
jgi:hypothetical protein